MCAEVLLFSGDFNFHHDDSSDDANTLAYHNMLLFQLTCLLISRTCNDVNIHRNYVMKNVEIEMPN